MRRPNEALFVRTYGVPGQVEPVQANIRYPESVAAAVDGADAVVNCVGILAEHGKQRFAAIHETGAAAIAAAAAAAGVGRLVHVSALGADPDSDSHYFRTKGAGERVVGEEYGGAIIMRPSIVFGTEDMFFNRFAAMARWFPIVPIVSADTRFQPVYVDDVARAVCLAVGDRSVSGICELGGPEILSFRDLIQKMLAVIRRRRLVLDLPAPIAGIAAFEFEMLQLLSGGLFVNKFLTRDQIRQLATDNVVGPGVQSLDRLGLVQTPMDAVLESYLYRFRPAGQYTSIHESARIISPGEDAG